MDKQNLTFELKGVGNSVGKTKSQSIRLPDNTRAVMQAALAETQAKVRKKLRGSESIHMYAAP